MTPRNRAKFLVITMLTLVAFISASVLLRGGVVRSATIREAEYLRAHSQADRQRNQDDPTRWTPPTSTVRDGTPFSATTPLYSSSSQPSTPGVNGKIAFARSDVIHEIYVMNTDGSNQMNLTNALGLDDYSAWSPDGTKVAFVSERDQNSEIYVMNANGSNQKRLTNDPASDSEPTWSPDGGRIAFTRYQANTASIYVMNADGSNQTRLPDSGSYPAWSPDGARIAFTSDRDADKIRPEIYVMNADGGNPTRLTTNFAYDSDPAWSPDGTRIAFTSDSAIYTMNSDGSNQRKLTDSEADLDPTWSPDGSKIAFTRGLVWQWYEYIDEIFVMNADGTMQTNLTNSVAWESRPAWSPDGAKILFTYYESFDSEISVTNADGSGLTILTNNSMDDFDPAWSPDGTKIAFVRWQSAYSILTINAHGSNEKLLINAGGFSALLSPTWSPDGNKIAFVSSSDNSSDIFVMNADGSGQANLTNGVARNVNPVWSPDGSKIVFVRRSGNFSADIVVKNADGSGQTNLTNSAGTGWNTDPAWSPDGTRIAFAFDGLADFIGAELYVMNADGSNKTRLTNDQPRDEQPTWSPDGSRIAWIRGGQIYVMNADGSNMAGLTDSLEWNTDLEWSPDGTKIAFIRNYLQIYLMNADGSNQTRLGLGGISSGPHWQALPGPIPNPIDDAAIFVRQHYLDFLNREPDASGLSFWTNEITQCGGDTQCIEAQRVNVSAAFFVSIEFQETGYLVYRMYKAAYGDMPGTPVPLTMQEFLPDTQRMGLGVIVNQTGWEQVLENNKNTFASEFVARSRFTTAFPQAMTAEQFVNTLNANAGGVLSQDERNQLVSDLASGTKTRAQVLRSVAEDADFAASEFNKAFVLMQYFGYLLRNPNDAPDADFAGYAFWLNKLNQFNGDFLAAEMVKAFINSGEYRQRFGQP